MPSKESENTLSEEDLLPGVYQLLQSQFPDVAKALSKAAKKVHCPVVTSLSAFN
jgi:hypothetical protein